MRLVITIKQPGQKTKKIESPLGMEFGLASAKLVWEAELILNKIPGSDLQWKIGIEE